MYIGNLQKIAYNPDVFKDMSFNRLLCVFCLTVLSIPIIVLSQPTNSTIKQSLSTSVESTHAKVSARVLSISERIDNILGYDEATEVSNKSHISLRLTSTNNSVQGADFNTSINTKLVLPRTQKRLHLFLNNIRQGKEEDDLVTVNEYYTETEEPIDDEFQAGVRQMLFQSKDFHFHTDLGARLQSPIDPYLKLKARQIFEAKTLTTTLTQEAYTYQHSGYGYDLQLKLDRPINLSLSARLTNKASYSDQYRFYRLQHTLSFIQLLKDNKSFVYFLSSDGTDETAVQALSYNVGITYRTSVNYWDWMRFTVTPFVNFARVRDFDSNPGLTVRLETTFGAI